MIWLPAQLDYQPIGGWRPCLNNASFASVARMRVMMPIEVDQSDGFILSCGFLHAHLRMIPPPALSGAKPIFDVNSRLMKAVERMFERCCVEHGPTPTQAML